MPRGRWDQNVAYDEDQALGIELGPIHRPGCSRRRNVRPILLGHAYAFLKQMPCRSKNRQTEPILAFC
jgi:hypothetical protein